MTGVKFRAAMRAPQMWGFTALAVLGPSLSILVPRIMAGVLPVTALLAIGGLAISEKRLPRMERMPWAIVALVIALCAGSSLWAPDAGFVLDSTARMAGALVSGLLLFYVAGELSQEQRRILAVLFFGGFIFALTFISVNRLTGSALLLPFLSERDIANLSERDNRSIVILSLMLWPALFAAQSLFKNQKLYQKLTLLLIPLTFLISLITDSQTAGASILVGALIYCFSRFAPRGASPLMAYGGGLLILTLPCLILLLRHYDPMIGFNWRAASVGARLEIWYAVADGAMRSPIIGHGMEAARFVSNWGMTHLYYPFDTILHPHNGVLQIWYEFGLVGAAAAAGIWLGLVRRIGILPNGEISASLALLSSVALVSTISHGLWQSWWLGAVGLCPALIRMVRRQETEN